MKQVNEQNFVGKVFEFTNYRFIIYSSFFLQECTISKGYLEKGDLILVLKIETDSSDHQFFKYLVLSGKKTGEMGWEGVVFLNEYKWFVENSFV